MTFRLAVGLVALLLLVAGILLLRPSPLPAAREIDVMASLVTHFIAPLGDVPVASAASDCRTGGVTRAVVPAALFDEFVRANGGAEPFDLAPFRERLRLAGSEIADATGRSGAPVVSVSRAGILEDDALVCVEVFGREDRAFFVLLRRDHEGAWTVARELTAWEAPEDPDTDPDAVDDEPLFLPRPSALDRALREP